MRKLPQLSLATIEAREARDWTQEDLAEKSGLSIATISRIETGKIKTLKRHTLRVLHETLKLPLDVLGLGIEPQLKMVMENELLALLRPVFLKKYEIAQADLTHFKERYSEYIGTSYFDQLILLGESVVFHHPEIRQKGLNKAIKGIRLSQEKVIVDKNKKGLVLDFQYIEMTAFNLIEYALIKAIADELGRQRKYPQSLRTSQALIVSLQKPTVDQSITMRLFPVICHNTAVSLRHLNKHTEALGYANQGINYCVDNSNTRPLVGLYQLVSDIYQDLHDPPNAHLYQQKCQQILLLLEE